MHLPEIDKFAHLKSPLHSWDPRVKIVSISVLILSVVLLKDLRAAFLGLILAITLVSLCKIPFSFVFVHLRWVLFFIVALFVILSLTVPGSIFVGLSFLGVSREGFELSLLISLRAISAVLLIFPMLGTTRFDLSLKALQKLKVPDRLIQLLMFTYRYIFLFMNEEKRIFTAAASRGWIRKTNLSTLKTMGNLVGMLLVRSFDRTERVRDAMLSRGYSGRLKTLDDLTLCWKDFLKGALVAVGGLLLHLLGWMG